MRKTILVTGATDGIGRETAKRLIAAGHHVLLHGRSQEKLSQVIAACRRPDEAPAPEAFVADLADLDQAAALADAVSNAHDRLDGLINNAGVYRTSTPITAAGLDTRFVVNTLAPYVLVRRLLPRLGNEGRIVNVSSAAQAAVDIEALLGQQRLSDGAAYAQSKLAITTWSRAMADELGPDGPVIIAVNPASMLGSKMVQEAFGVKGGDLGIGANILVQAALDDRFADATGRYYDNDRGAFGEPHPETTGASAAQVMATIRSLVRPWC